MGEGDVIAVFPEDFTTLFDAVLRIVARPDNLGQQAGVLADQFGEGVSIAGRD